MQKNSKLLNTTRVIAYTAVSTALVMVTTMIGIPFAQFYFNLGDTVILITSVLFGPITGLIAGGFGSFFADMIVYPSTMFFTLIIKGIEGLICGLLHLIVFKKTYSTKIQAFLSIIASLISGIFMFSGYFICNTFFYGTITTALVALPMDALQASISVALSFVILYVFRLIKIRDRLKLTA